MLFVSVYEGPFLVHFCSSIVLLVPKACQCYMVQHGIVCGLVCAVLILINRTHSAREGQSRLGFQN